MSKRRKQRRHKARKKSGKAAKTRGPKKAETADRHVLYEASVQDAEAEIEFMEEVFEALRNRPARVLREDFCGTANVACKWTQRHDENQAYAVDIDPSVLAWGRERHYAALSEAARERVEFIEGDVTQATTPGADVAVALNFSYMIFMTRDRLREYFRHLRSNLNPEGIFIIDVFGGSEAIEEMRERRKCEGFTYVWDQAEYDPISADITCHIHFEFPDRSKLDKAFTYHWRLWTLPELRELLAEAGFSKSTVYWQGEDEDGEGDGEFEPVTRGDADPAWICYIVAEN
ncbi:MAG: class I SAM-dependent methyltransferase [Gammaproteobacteria bacterium]